MKIRFSPLFFSKCLLASCGIDRKCRLWEVSKSNQASLSSFELGSSPGSALNFNKDDLVLVTGLENGSIKLWDVETNQNTRTLPGHRSEV